MLNEVKISVIVPAYNNAPWLPRCLDSLLAQTYHNLEIIVVDDGSVDDTQNILKQYLEKDSRVCPIYQENRGVTSARLHGVREATGAWIGFVDGDDAVEADMYEHLLRNAIEHDADISHCGYQMNFEDNRVNYFHNTGVLEVYDRDTSLRELLSGAKIEPGLCNKLFRSDLFENLLGSDALDPEIKINEDLLMNFILFSNAKNSVFEDFCPYHYIVRNGSATRQQLNVHKIYDPIRVKESILSVAPDGVIQAAQAAYLSTCVNVYNSIVTADQAGLEHDRREVRKMILQHSAWFSLLSRKQQFLAGLIRYLPWAYRSIYRFYAAHLMRNPYI